MTILERLQQALTLEKNHEIQAYEALLQQKTLQERVKQGLSFYPIQWIEEKPSVGNKIVLTFRSEAFERHASKLQNGQVVAVFTLQELPKKESNSLKAVIISSQKDTLQLMPYAEELPDWLENGKLGIDLYFDETTYQLMEKALENLHQKGSPSLEKFKNICFGQAELTFRFIPSLSDPQLNESQLEAVRKILTANELAILHGPPGTGKTTTLVEAIRYLVKSGKRVLACAPSNTATDLLARKTHQKGLKVLRLGHPARMDPEIWQLTLDAQIQQQPFYPSIQELKERAFTLKKQAKKFKRHYGLQEQIARKEALQEVNQLRKEASELEKRMLNSVLEEAQVVCCTLTGASHELLEKRQFDVLVIDEAAQALEPACWIAIPKAHTCILAGDHHQLPPTVKSIEAEKLGLSCTLFERLIQQYPEASTMLKTQYRSHSKIMKFSSDFFYKGQLEPHESVKSIALSDHEPVLTFIDTAGAGYDEIQDPETLSHYNPQEAQILVQYLKDLRLRYAAASLGILSPYQQQVQLLSQLAFSEPSLRSAKVDTIDGFQGEERDIIAISLVRSNEEGTIGFLKDIRRMNVALTRAKKKLIVIGDSSTLANHPFYEKLLNYWSQEAEYKTVWEYSV